MLLKGSHAVIKRALDRLKLGTGLKILYEVADTERAGSDRTKVHIMLDDKHPIPEHEFDRTLKTL